MKAVVTTKYGTPDVLELREVQKPAPNDDEVLIKVHAASVNATDWHAMRGRPIRTLRGVGYLYALPVTEEART